MKSGFTGSNMHSRSIPWYISVVVLFVEAMIAIENMHEQKYMVRHIKRSTRIHISTQERCQTYIILMKENKDTTNNKESDSIQGTALESVNQLFELTNYAND
jgi:hypothetical protein